MFRIRRILVPLDTTKLSDRVMDAALTMAERFGARIRVLFVRDEQGPLPDDEQEVEVTIEGLLQHVRDHAKRGGHSVPASSIEAELRTGVAEEEIVRCVEESSIDLVLMGTHGRHGIGDRLLGSTTERVFQRTAVPMLILREGDETERV